ncbi:glutamate-5-semialdehyde dehydrogenase [Spirulina sp. CS-785/01]|nr:glutamate-5-semialdehyde dehydrogenase [Spirulina sp. CS-785/01]MDB9312909.1 glutamate-5-semialdehyde dehydrogenase [Spirulina sp. CS-785/01]
MVATDISPTTRETAQQTKAAARQLAVLSTEDRNAALNVIADALTAASEDIVAANQTDCANAEQDGISSALYARLKLSETKLKATIAGVRDVANLADPVGQMQIHRELDEGLVLKRVTCPLGVLGIIFEARPEALIQITALAVKSGNGVILKGGKEAIQSCQTLTRVIRDALSQTNINPNVVQLLTTREEIRELLALDEEVDLIIPRGSNSFVRYVQENTRIPVLGHADGICHVYVDAAADLKQAVDVTVDAKVQYPAACNAVETLLVHQQVAGEFLPQVAIALQENGVELRGCDRSLEFLSIPQATPEDWSTEYSDLVLSIRVVESLEDAIGHINTYGSKHTDSIITQNPDTAHKFLKSVDAAGVFHNCSTRFSDGFRYGFGAEVGISTQQMPPRGPVGLEGLVTYKYQLVGDGHIAATYSGENAKPFTHRTINN